MPRHTTPLDREILTHFYCCPGPFPRSSVGITNQIRLFLRLGLLRIDTAAPHGSAVVANRPALEAYMEALGAVPLPVKTEVWAVPNGELDEG